MEILKNVLNFSSNILLVYIVITFVIWLKSKFK